MTKENKNTFEAAMGKLEDIVRHLEKGDMPLDDSLKAFEEGIKWSRVCEEKLNEAKGKVEKLIKTGSGTIETIPFKPEE